MFPGSIPPPPYGDPLAESGATPGNRILCVRSVETVIDNIPDEILQKPTDDETWTRCFLLVDDLATFRATIECIPQLHVVGKTLDDQYYEVAMCERFVQYLLDVDFPFLLASETALQRHGRGLDEYYQRHTGNHDLLAAINWAFLMRDILESSPEALQRFAQDCVLIALHSLQDVADAFELEMMERNEQEWFRFFQELCTERIKRPIQDPRAEMQLIMLLQGVLESASGQITGSRQPLTTSSYRSSRYLSSQAGLLRQRAIHFSTGLAPATSLFSH
ncbi:putative Coiled-coil-helix-coiled-coil-helix domain-containing protein [Seiridium cardinale]